MSVAHKFEDRARTDDVLISETVDFPGLLLSKPVLKGLADGGFLKPSPIQLKAIPLGRCGLDLIVQAKSGTGKTCVFTVVALESVDTTSSSLQVLVLAPTREIAQQIQSVIQEIGSAMPGLKCHTFIGGLPILQDKILCKNCHIAVGTPGRVKQLLEIGALKANSIRLFVLDEADKLLENSFQESINWIYSSLPENKQILALSATYPEYLADHLTRYMRNPTFVRLNAADPALLGIKQYHVVVPHHSLPNFVFNVKTEMVVKIISSVSFQQCLIFSNMQTRAQDLQTELQSRNWPTACIAGCLQQQERSFAMDQLKSYKCRILISTDLTSRGIDADKVNLVINLDVPPDHETYLHRIGRAGRFGSFGAAITIVSKGGQEKDLWRIEKRCKTYIHPLPDPLPSDLVAKPVPVRLDDVVSTEQIITDPDTTAPQGLIVSGQTNPETEVSETLADVQTSSLSEHPVSDIETEGFCKTSADYHLYGQVSSFSEPLSADIENDCPVTQGCTETLADVQASSLSEHPGADIEKDCGESHGCPKTPSLSDQVLSLSDPHDIDFERDCPVTHGCLETLAAEVLVSSLPEPLGADIEKDCYVTQGCIPHVQDSGVNVVQGPMEAVSNNRQLLLPIEENCDLSSRENNINEDQALSSSKDCNGGEKSPPPKQVPNVSGQNLLERSIESPGFSDQYSLQAETREDDTLLYAVSSNTLVASQPSPGSDNTQQVSVFGENDTALGKNKDSGLKRTELTSEGANSLEDSLHYLEIHQVSLLTEAELQDTQLFSISSNGNDNNGVLLKYQDDPEELSKSQSVSDNENVNNIDNILKSLPPQDIVSMNHVSLNFVPSFETYEQETRAIEDPLLETKKELQSSNGFTKSRISNEAEESETKNDTETESTNHATKLLILTGADGSCGTNEVDETQPIDDKSTETAEGGTKNGKETQLMNDHTEPCVADKAKEKESKALLNDNVTDETKQKIQVSPYSDNTESYIKEETGDICTEDIHELQSNCEVKEPGTAKDSYGTVPKMGSKIPSANKFDDSSKAIEADESGTHNSVKTDSNNGVPDPFTSQDVTESENTNSASSSCLLSKDIMMSSVEREERKENTNEYSDKCEKNLVVKEISEMGHNSCQYVCEQGISSDVQIWKDELLRASEHNDEDHDSRESVTLTPVSKVIDGRQVSNTITTEKEFPLTNAERPNVPENMPKEVDLFDIVNNIERRTDDISVAPSNLISSAGTDQQTILNTDEAGMPSIEDHNIQGDKSGNADTFRAPKTVQSANSTTNESECDNMESQLKKSVSSTSSPRPTAKAKRKPSNRSFALSSFLDQLRSENESLNTLALAKTNILNSQPESVTLSGKADEIEGNKDFSFDAKLEDGTSADSIKVQGDQNNDKPDIISPKAMTAGRSSDVSVDDKSNTPISSKLKNYASTSTETKSAEAEAEAVQAVLCLPNVEALQESAVVENFEQVSLSDVNVHIKSDGGRSEKSSVSLSQNSALVCSILEDTNSIVNQSSFDELEKSLQAFRENFDGKAEFPPETQCIFRRDESFSEDSPELQAYCREEIKRLHSVKKSLLERKENAAEQRQIASEADTTPNKQKTCKQTFERKTPTKFKGPLPKDTSSYEKALYEHVKARKAKDAVQSNDTEVSSPDVLTGEKDVENSSDSRDDISPNKSVDVSSERRAQNNAANEECKKLDDMHEEMLRRRKLRKANKKSAFEAKERETEELNQLEALSNTSSQFESNKPTNVESHCKLQQSIESKVLDESDMRNTQAKDSTEKYLNEKVLTKRVDPTEGLENLPQSCEEVEEDKSRENFPSALKTDSEGIIGSQDNDKENQSKNSPKALRTISKVADHDYNNSTEEERSSNLGDSVSNSESERAALDQDAAVLFSEDAEAIAEGTPSNASNRRYPGVQTSAKKSLTPIFNAIHREQLSCTKPKRQQLKQNQALKSLQICQRSPLKTLMVAQPEDEVFNNSSPMPKYKSPELDIQDLNDNATKETRDTKKKSKTAKAEAHLKKTKRAGKERESCNETKKVLYKSLDLKSSKPSKSAARLAGLEVSEGSTSSSSSDSCSSSSRDLKGKDLKSAKKIDPRAHNSKSRRRVQRDHETSAATSGSSKYEDFFDDKRQPFPYFPHNPSCPPSHYYPWYQPHTQAVAHPQLQHWSWPGYNTAYPNSANRFHPHIVPTSMASSSMQPVHNPYYHYHQDYYNHYYSQYGAMPYNPHPSMWNGYSGTDRQQQLYDTYQGTMRAPHSIQASMQLEYVCHMTKESIRFGKKFRKSMRLNKS